MSRTPCVRVGCDSDGRVVYDKRQYCALHGLRQVLLDRAVPTKNLPDILDRRFAAGKTLPLDAVIIFCFNAIVETKDTHTMQTLLDRVLSGTFGVLSQQEIRLVLRYVGDPMFLRDTGLSKDGGGIQDATHLRDTINSCVIRARSCK